ncbi:MAG: UDP-N-acetylmuramoyl-L-alanyl-D-glutamate--2,6-diaminopimelate ligase [Aphanocapsa feldmannii 277cV]|uniref:UDP-N-acetylmuramoyl-L-alanyl-D-glutamate--2,6-diaminopimelate ligase n=2 Tax=Aphanocapsa feldmannii TaxID=192050 RepID=A0A524RNK4_9CHRO|nr:MAG: UDP-N-acetylmuramoyl-L-alanyl-D-glutamate--2,6-diaminopimelate ligase [Aphanocapsa feldmannii 277cV]TGH24021.1 MAG: UDP-N-acetylmuramoyl-L-alanyl-D-glutamate--2,6-diaminopimelate ligase [Aphanocapsa feldmannii 277cI]
MAAVPLGELFRSVGLPLPAGADAAALVSRVDADSRRVERGSLFVGLPGTRLDGGCFWADALSRGALLCVVSEAAAAARPAAPGQPLPAVVRDPAAWLGPLAAALHGQPSTALELVGVTGTNGKTTTTHLIEHLSCHCGAVTGLFGTLENRWPGHALTASHTTAFADRLQDNLAQAVASGVERLAMEVSSHALAQQRVAGCRFSAAIFTNLSQDHLDYHHDLERYFEAKAMLFSDRYLAGRAVVNGEDPYGQRLARQLGERAWRCAVRDGAGPAVAAELWMDGLTLSAAGARGRLQSPLGSGPFQSPLLGRFNLMNLLQAVGVLLQLGCPLATLLEGITSFSGVPGRMEQVPADDLSVIVDYAHTPDGLENALVAVRPFVEGELICLFGCGGDRDRGKRPRMAAIASRLADRVMVTSDNPRTEDPRQIVSDVLGGIPQGTFCLVEQDRSLAIQRAILTAAPGDTIFIAGKGHEDYQVLGTTKVHFDDREQAAEAIQRRRQCLRVGGSRPGAG